MKLERTLSVIAAVAGLCGASSAIAQVANGTPGNLVVNGSMDFVDAAATLRRKAAITRPATPPPPSPAGPS